jgi:hypothetical protein
MPFDLTPDVHVGRGADGKVRQLSHPQSPYRPGAADLLPAGLAAEALTPRSLAEQYIRDTAAVYDLAPGVTGNFAAALAPQAGDAGVELRFTNERNLANSVTVDYDQTVYGLPIWDAGMTVRIDSKLMAVTGSHNATHYDIRAHKPSPNASYVPHGMDAAKTRTVLGLKPTDPDLTVTATRALVYRYRAKDRFDSQIEAHRKTDASVGLAGVQASDFPSLPLPAVPQQFVEGDHYVVTEVLFRYPYAKWGTLNWRIFVDPDTGAVLYLRALVSCASGQVFRFDPVTTTGLLHSAATAVAVLNPLRTTVDLLGLNQPVVAGGPQELGGEFVRLADLDPPHTAMPLQNPPYAFHYSCETDDFASCNAYHHSDGVFRLIQGMGIDVKSYFANTTFPLPVDPHALNGEINAQARGNPTGNGLGSLVFGVARTGTTFGISTDVRVVMHEFGHAFLWNHVNSPNFGFAHSAGDSFGAILLDPNSRAPDPFESFPFMKESSGLSRRHDRDVAAGWAWGGDNDDTQYGSEQILSTTLFRVYQAAGGASAADPAIRLFASRYTAYLILKAIGLLARTTSDPDVFVAALTEADATNGLFEGHPGGAFSKVFRWSFEKQGLYQPAGAPPPAAAPGQPPEVDVYIDDGRAGEYMPYLQNFEGTPELWNRLAADGAAANQTPAVGVPNFAYARIRNRGTANATGITIRAFQSRVPGKQIWPTDWKPLTPAVVVVPHNIPAGGSIVIGPLAWTPQFASEGLLIGVSAAGDRSNLETVTAGPLPTERLVRLDNNTVQRTF